MKIEDINEKSVGMASDEELRNFRERANQMYRAERGWASAIRKRLVGVKDAIGWDRLLEIYGLIDNEVRKRNLKVKDNDLDHRMFKRRVRGIDVSDFPAVLVAEAVVSLSGDFVTSPKRARAVTVRIDADEFGDRDFPLDLEPRLMEMLAKAVGLPVIVRLDADGLEAPIIPIWDLMLVPRADTEDEQDVEGLRKRLESRRMDDRAEGYRKVGETGETALEPVSGGLVLEYISKPFPNEHAARQLDPKGFDSFARKNNHFGPGIHAIFGIKAGKSKVQSVRFSAAKFTTEQAKAWLKEHGYKTTLEAAKPTKKDEGADVLTVKSEEMRICGGIVYMATSGAEDELDSDRDFVDSGDEIYEAMKSWMLRGHEMRFMHNGEPVNTPLIECFHAEYETAKAGQIVPKNSWYISNYIPPEAEDLWIAIKNGSVRGYSMSGKSKVEVIED